MYLRILLTIGAVAEVAEPARECMDLARRFDEQLVLTNAQECYAMGLVYGGVALLCGAWVAIGKAILRGPADSGITVAFLRRATLWLEKNFFVRDELLR